MLQPSTASTPPRTATTPDSSHRPFRLTTYNTASTPLQDTQDDTVHRIVTAAHRTCRIQDTDLDTFLHLWYLVSRHATNSLHSTPSPSPSSATTKRRLVLLLCSLLNSCSPGHLHRREPTQQQHGTIEVCWQRLCGLSDCIGVAGYTADISSHNTLSSTVPQ